MPFDQATRRVSLGVKQVNDIWSNWFEKHKVGDLVRGRVSRVTTFGAFVELSGGIEGLCHISEIDERRPKGDKPPMAGPGEISTPAHAIASVLALAMITFFHITLGEQVPKILALQRAEAWILFAVQPVTVLAWVFTPFINLLYGFTNLVLRSIGLEYHGEEHAVHSPEELQLLVSQSARAGLLSPPERELVQRAFAFSDQTAGEVPDAIDVRVLDRGQDALGHLLLGDREGNRCGRE